MSIRTAPTTRRRSILAACLILPSLGWQDAGTDPEEPSAPTFVRGRFDGPAVLTAEYEAEYFDEEKLKPVPVVIPDDPPPHEGAMFDCPVIIEPPDLVRIEVLEAAPGRPMTGERLVRFDGTVSLDFYGDVHVRGLTTEQAKVKVIKHLRGYLTDEALGLIEIDPESLEYVLTPPGESSRVYVQVAAFNSKVYYIQGEVMKPGRHASTGDDTVLDAINGAGGFMPTVADPPGIHLYRPARGDQPARDYAIDWPAIRDGDERANLQVFPGDRIVVGRDARFGGDRRGARLMLDRADPARPVRLVPTGAPVLPIPARPGSGPIQDPLAEPTADLSQEMRLQSMRPPSLRKARGSVAGTSPELFVAALGDAGELPEELAAEFFDEAELTPQGPVSIPDDPPPHEGAMIDYPLVVGPPDLIRIEVLEAAPGRPITGECLVRPDGTASLDFYGDLFVRGLTPSQIKVKVIRHMRQFLTDDALGIVEKYPARDPKAAEPRLEHADGEVPPLPDRASPFDLLPDDLLQLPPQPEGSNPDDHHELPEVPSRSLPDADSPSGRSPFDLGPATSEPDDGKPSPSASPQRITIEAGEVLRITIETPAASSGEAVEARTATGEEEPIADEESEELVTYEYFAVPPSDSSRVSVDIAAFHSNNYYVSGDVVVPGRLIFTGNDTVLDAINYAGGFLPAADRNEIRLHRPVAGDAPARVYAIDWWAILAGDVTANLQVLPGDRIVVGGRPNDKAAIGFNREIADSRD